MNTLPLINIIQIIMPFLAGLGLVLFRTEDERNLKFNIHIYSIASIFISLFAIIILVFKKQEIGNNFGILSFDGGFLHQKDAVKFIAVSSLGFFFQMRNLSNERENLSLKIFFNGVFFSFLNLSMYVRGGPLVYYILELLVLSTMMMGGVSNYLWTKKNLILQGLGTSLILISYIFDKNFFDGEFSYSEILSGLALVGILLKSTIFEYKEGGVLGGRVPKNMMFYLVIIKLYLPIRFFYEANISQVVNFDGGGEWVILGFCLMNAMMIQTKGTSVRNLQLMRILSGIIILGLLTLETINIDLLIKNALYLILIFIFYINARRSELNDVFFLVVLILSVLGITSGFYLDWESSTGKEMSVWLFASAALTLYLVIKNLWSLLGLTLRRYPRWPSNAHIIFIQNIVILAMIFILIEADIEYFVAGGPFGIQ